MGSLDVVMPPGRPLGQIPTRFVQLFLSGVPNETVPDVFLVGGSRRDLASVDVEATRIIRGLFSQVLQPNKIHDEIDIDMLLQATHKRACEY
jgi:hypothetical protein